jgi:hypothetical protein
MLMAQDLSYLPGFEGIQVPNPENRLWSYLQSQPPELFQDITQSSSSEAREILSFNLRSLLGSLPPDQFGVQIVTSREGLAKMLSGAMLGGYFLRAMEQRMQLEHTLSSESGSRSEDNHHSEQK